MKQMAHNHNACLTKYTTANFIEWQSHDIKKESIVNRECWTWDPSL